MSITIDELIDGREGTDTVDGKGRRVITHKRIFGCTVTDPKTDDSVILAQNSISGTSSAYIPVMWAYYFAANGAGDGSRVIKRTPKQVEAFRWQVDVEYSTAWMDELKADLNPLDRPYKVNWNTRDVTIPIEDDNDGNYLTNSAFEPFDPPITDEMGLFQLTVEKNFAFFDAGLYSQFLTPRKAVNQGTFFGFDEAQVKILSITGSDTQNEGEQEYYVVTFTFAVNDATWDRYILDQGYCEFDVATNKQTPIVEGGGIVQKPRLLDGTGQRLARGADAIFLGPFKVNPRKDFAALGIS
jgi:hypothetical protein